MASEPLFGTTGIWSRSGWVVGQEQVVLYKGFLAQAHAEGLTRITTHLRHIPTEKNARTAITKAEAVTSKGTFEGIGNASPENVPAHILPHLIRMAETRAKARALRDAVNIGVVSFEELAARTTRLLLPTPDRGHRLGTAPMARSRLHLLPRTAQATTAGRP